MQISIVQAINGGFNGKIWVYNGWIIPVLGGGFLKGNICSAALSDSWVEDHGHHLSAEVPNALLPCFVAPTGSSIWMFYGILMDLS